MHMINNVGRVHFPILTVAKPAVRSVTDWNRHIKPLAGAGASASVAGLRSSVRKNKSMPLANRITVVRKTTIACTVRVLRFRRKTLPRFRRERTSSYSSNQTMKPSPPVMIKKTTAKLINGSPAKPIRLSAPKQSKPEFVNADTERNRAWNMPFQVS